MTVTTAANEEVSIRLPARLWSAIDGEVDNVVSLAAVEGDEVVVEQGRAIRQAGWDQVPWVAGQWPPMDQVIIIRMTRRQWQFALDHVQQGNAIYAELGDDESLALGRAALACVGNQIGEPESSP